MLNQRRLRERGIEFEQVVSLLSRTLANQQLVQPHGHAMVSIIADYARSWSLLQGYDEQSLTELSTNQRDMQALSLDNVLSAIAQLKQELIQKGEASEVFASFKARA